MQFNLILVRQASPLWILLTVRFLKNWSTLGLEVSILWTKMQLQINNCQLKVEILDSIQILSCHCALQQLKNIHRDRLYYPKSKVIMLTGKAQPCLWTLKNRWFMKIISSLIKNKPSHLSLTFIRCPILRKTLKLWKVIHLEDLRQLYWAKRMLFWKINFKIRNLSTLVHLSGVKYPYWRLKCVQPIWEECPCLQNLRKTKLIDIMHQPVLLGQTNSTRKVTIRQYFQML